VELLSARSVRSRALWVRKFSYLPIRPNVVMTSVYSVYLYTLGVREGNWVSARWGEEYVIFSLREIMQWICATPCFSWWEIMQEIVTIVAFKNLFTLGTYYYVFHSIRILWPWPSKKSLLQQTIANLLKRFAYKWRGTGKRVKRKVDSEKIIRWRASEEDHRVEVSMLHLDTCSLIAEADRVLYHLMFSQSFCTASTQIQLPSTFVCYSWLACLLGFWLRNAPLDKK